MLCACAHTCYKHNKQTMYTQVCEPPTLKVGSVSTCMQIHANPHTHTYTLPSMDWKNAKHQDITYMETRYSYHTNIQKCFSIHGNFHAVANNRIGKTIDDFRCANAHSIFFFGGPYMCVCVAVCPNQISVSVFV